MNGQTDYSSFLQKQFPDPKSLVDDLHQNGFKAIWMLDPGIKHEEGYFVYDSGSERDIWIQTADGKPFVGIYYSYALRENNDDNTIEENVLVWSPFSKENRLCHFVFVLKFLF